MKTNTTRRTKPCNYETTETLGFVSTARLRLIELTLDHKLLHSPVAISQRVEVELIKRLEREAPWLIPMTIK